MDSGIKYLIDLEAKIYGTTFVEQSSCYYNEDAKKCGLSKVEFLTLRMLVSNGESLIQKHLYEKTNPNELESLLCKYLDAAISKLPIEEDAHQVCRVLNNSSINKGSIGSVVVMDAYLTCSRQLLSDETKYVYIIDLARHTKARCLYMVYEVNPILPEYQVEFPRGTKFLVTDVYNQGDKTIVEMVEQDDELLPVEQLSLNITDFYRNISTIDINGAVKSGKVKNLAKYKTWLYDENGKKYYVNAEAHSNGQVYISPTFAQAMWCLCYAALKVSDYDFLKSNYERLMKMSVEDVSKMIQENDCREPEAEYVVGLVESEPADKMLALIDKFMSNTQTLDEEHYLCNIPLNTAFTTRVDALYMAAGGMCLLHEFVHIAHEHFKNSKGLTRHELEMDSDNTAFDSLLALEPQIRKTGIYGGICMLLTLLFMNPHLTPSSSHPREDTRLFAQYDKLKDEKHKSAIMIATVMRMWMKIYHGIDVNCASGMEENFVEQIRNILNKI